MPREPSRDRALFPSVLCVVLDDVGFGHMSCYGGPVDTPNLDRLAAAGLRYTRYHSASSGGELLPLVRTRTSSAWSSVSGAENALEEALPRAFGLSGYGTLSLGGRRARTAGRTRPCVREMFDEALARLDEIERTSPASPFYFHLAPGSIHGMRSIPAEWVERYRGRFCRGWEMVRRANVARQRAMGLCGAHDDDHRIPLGLPHWNDMTESERRVARRVMELFAAGLSLFDEQLGRLLSALARTGRLNETATIIMSREGLNAVSARRTAMLAPWVSGWRWAARRPSSRSGPGSQGSGADPLIVHWPDGIVGGGAIRRVPAGMVDIPPTLLEISGFDAVCPADGHAVPGGRSLARSFWQTELLGGAHATRESSVLH